MIMELDLTKVPAWVWTALGAGALWIIKAWADKRYAKFKEPLTQEQIEQEETARTRRILQSKAFEEAADHQVNITMMSEKFFCAAENVFTHSMKVSDGIRLKVREEIATQVSDKITGMGDTQKIMLTAIEEMRTELIRFGTRLEMHMEQEIRNHP